MCRYSKKFFASLIIIIALLISHNPAEPARARRTSASRPKAQQSGFYSLSGTWSVSDAVGSATDSRLPGAEIEIIAEKFIFTVEEVKFYESSGEGTANIIYNCAIVDMRGNILNQRTWEYALPYDVKREAPDKWTFSTEYLDGEDKITIALKNSKTAEIRFEGVNWDDVFPEDRKTFDVTCEAVKK